MRLLPWSCSLGSLLREFLSSALPSNVAAYHRTKWPGQRECGNPGICIRNGIALITTTANGFFSAISERTAFTAYHALSDMTPDEARHWLERATVKELPSIVNVMLPVAVGSLTVAVNVTAWPKTDGLTDDDSVVLSQRWS